MQSSLESLARSLGQDDDDDDELQATFMRIALCDFSAKNPAGFVKQRAIDNNSPQRNQSEQAPSAGNKLFSA
jgi:hypothetical protein